MRTKDALQKIEGTQFFKTLEHKKDAHKRLIEAGYETEAKNVKGSIAGYCQALYHCGIITEAERRVLILYYIA